MFYKKKSQCNFPKLKIFGKLRVNCLSQNSSLLKLHGKNRSSLFQWIGKHIADSRTPHLLNQPRILEKDSLKGFLTGKSDIRCRMIHQILGAAMEMFHFRGFDSSFNNGNLYVSNDKLKLIKVEKKMFLKGSYWSPRWLSAVFKRYFGSYPAQHWTDYIEMLHRYYKFSRSIHTGDVDLPIRYLTKIANHFFAFNYRIYPRWLVLFHDNLLKLHPYFVNNPFLTLAPKIV